MWLPFLPVAQRELMVASRKGILYWMRLAAPVLGLILLFGAAPGLQDQPPAIQGKIIFRHAALALFVYSVLAGLCYTAETISGERREGTLPLLQLTGMREVDLVVGKLFASALPGLFGFFAAIPLLGLPFLFGGVTPGQFCRALVVLFGTLVFSLAAGMYASSQTYSRGSALKKTFGILIGVLGLGCIGVVYAGVRRRFTGSEKWTGALRQADVRLGFIFAFIAVWSLGLPTGSPGYLLLQAVYGARGFPLRGMSFALGVLILFALAAWHLLAARPFKYVENLDGPAEISEKPNPLHRRAYLAPGADPFRFLFAPTAAELILTLGWALVGGACHLFSNGLIYEYSRIQDPVAGALAWIAFGVTAFIYFLLARRAADFLVEARRCGLLEVLLVSPVTWEELLRMQRAAFLRFSWLPAMILLIGETLGIMAALRFGRQLQPLEFPIIFFALTVLTYLCSIFATLWAAVFFALRTRSATHAAFCAVALVLVAPGLAGWLVTVDRSNLLPAPFFAMVISSWIYILADTAIWAGCRIRLSALSGRSPTFICDGRSLKE